MFSLLRTVRRFQGAFYGHHCSMFSDEKSKQSTQTDLSKNPGEGQASKQTSQKNAHIQEASPSKLKKLSQQAQRAIWASSAIECIQNCTEPSLIRGSVTDQILTTVPKANKQYQLDQKCREQVFEMFKTGILFDNKFFIHDKVKDAILKRKTIFFPTYTVSKHIFQMMSSQNHYIFFGSFGIGKTFSFLMYIALAKYVNTLKYLALAPWIPPDQRKDFRRQYLDLLEKGFIIQVRKCWYWSINRFMREDENTLKVLILMQTDEFGFTDTIKKQLRACSSLQSLIEKINDMYKPTDFQDYGNNVESTVVFDQINIVTSYFRIHNNLLRLKSLEDKDDIKKNQFQCNRMKTIGDNMKKLIYKFCQLGNYSILNTSYLQNERITQTNEIFSQKMVLDYFYRANPIDFSLSYASELQKQYTKIEFHQFFCLLLQEMCKRNKVLPQNLKKIKDLMANQTIVISSSNRFLFIKQYIDEFERKKGPLLQTLREKADQSKIIQTVKSITAGFSVFCQDQFVEQLKSFLIEPKDGLELKDSFLFLLCIRSYAEKCKKSAKTKVGIYQGDLKELLSKVCKKPVQLQSFLFRDITKTKIGKKQRFQMFPFDVEKMQVRFDWEAESLIRIVDKAILQVAFRRPFSQIAKQWQQQHVQPIGVTIKAMLLMILKQAKSVKFRFGRGNAFYQIEGRASFIPFDNSFIENCQKVLATKKDSHQQENPDEAQLSPINTQCLKNNLSNLLKLARNDPDEFFYGYPLKSNQENSPTNKFIDFLFVRYDPFRYYYDIKLFDVTKRQKDSKALIEMFKKLLQSQPDSALISQQAKNGRDFPNDCNEFRFQRIVLTNPALCRQPIILSAGRLQVIYYSYQGMHFNGNYSREAQKLLEMCVQIDINSR